LEAKTLKRILVTILITACLSSAVAIAQTKGKSKTTKKTPPAKPAPADFSAERAKIGVQIGNVAQFIYVYGKVVNGLELAAQQEKTTPAADGVAAKNQQAKDGVVANIGNLKSGIDNLARSFQSDTRLQVQYLKLTGASDAIGSAQQAAGGARYDEAGKLLITAVERLTEALLAVK
jgi:hypothetical protein